MWRQNGENNTHTCMYAISCTVQYFYAVPTVVESIKRNRNSDGKTSLRAALTYARSGGQRPTAWACELQYLWTPSQ